MTDDLLMKRLQKSVDLTRRAPVENGDDQDYQDAHDRLKKLLAETKQMVAQAEALVAAMRSPAGYYKNT